ncbi:cyclic pyranopterin monophosphate synthase MoaC [Desulfovibrio ferrophilus]|uniref:Cyclic pyranopterin monophosphate synthase n=1 Tax=Desulfovibrio ferrophilus TaxID=241368 RepID=A0A2Z6AXI2_9BACT|nr:cyclic pyranopterin monophosphate synthase MoaC [Desulfovibrio ferrophilus]BBD07964.1 molybdenum cofactor biosynthesis protein C [Desulfovibrio ferrophilus]
MGDKLTHIDASGNARMVDVGDKASTRRVAIAEVWVKLSSKTYALLVGGALPKGDALGTAKVAGILAAKSTHQLIPMCHPLALSYVDVRFEPDEATCSLRIEAESRTAGPTGVEMEALTAVQVAALTVYDMCKAVQKDIVIEGCRLLHKSGGKSGTYEAR